MRRLHCVASAGCLVARWSLCGGPLAVCDCWRGWVQDVFDMPYHLARDRIEHSLRAKMASLQVTGPRPASVNISLL
jgi:hypothetical protein